MDPSKETLLITGASGFVGGRIVKEALDKGYHVVAAARSENTTKKIRDQFPEYYEKGQLSFTVVPDMTNKEHYKDILQNGPPDRAVTGIIHTSSPFNTSPKDNETDLLRPAINGALAVLQAAKEWGTRVKRVVATSSHAAVVDIPQGKRPGYTYDEKDWNPVTYAEAAREPDGTVAYCASKALAERAMWDFVARETPLHFDLVTLTPPWVFGPYAAELRGGTRGVSESMRLLLHMLDAAEVPAFDFGGFADVRELAAAHVLAFETPEAGGQRFWIGQKLQWQFVVDAAREGLPEVRDRLPVGRPGFVDKTYDVDGSKATRVLGLKYRPLAETVVDSFVQLLRAEKLDTST